MSQPLVTIGVPFYNSEKYLDDCLRSLISQTYSQIEILLVNDASTDESTEIANKYLKQDPRIRLINLPRREKIGFVRNVIIENSRGFYFLFVDSDDCLRASAVQDCLTRLASLPVDAAIIFNAEKRDEDGNYRGLLYKKRNRSFSRGEAEKAALSCSLYSYLWSFFCPLSIFNNLRFSDEHGSEDLTLFFSLLSKCSVLLQIGKVEYMYRIRKGSLTNSPSIFDNILCSYRFMLDYSEKMHFKKGENVLRWKIAETSSRKIAFFDFSTTDWKNCKKKLKPYRLCIFSHLFPILFVYNGTVKSKIGSFLLLFFPRLFCFLYQKYRIRRNG